MNKRVTLTNEFHNTRTSINCEVVQHIPDCYTICPNEEQIRRVKRILCGRKGCTCSADLGTNGAQTYKGKPLDVDIGVLYK